jgi:oxygen-independent coproporphyrinogen III oxidase
MIWETENKDSLFLYIHIPFCEMRCGFCNLFTMANPDEDMTRTYLRALARQSAVVKDAIGEVNFAQLAIGGGTPTFLNEGELESLFTIIGNTMGTSSIKIPASCEVSPKTVNKNKMQYLFEKGVGRISIGIQSFLEQESKLLGRPQRNDEVHKALTCIKDQQFQTLNIDLIYGGAGQTSETWGQTLYQTLVYDPDEVYLYPLYVRPLTGLDKMGMSWDNYRLKLYRQGRDYLLDHGYEQVSMRMFRKRDHENSNKQDVSYCCQEDGMVGLGSGARSYTNEIHYSSEYAVGRKGVKNIIRSFTDETEESFSVARYGVRLSEEEKKRRYIIKSLLHAEGLSLHNFFQRFASNALEDLLDLKELIGLGMAFITEEGDLKLTSAGLELSDSIGPTLYSSNMNNLMHQFELQ